MKSEFIISCTDVAKFPLHSLPEFAFVGRSNVGKSSLINMLAGKKQLAKTSSTPGKTQLFNFFLVDASWMLVDLPGIGYARVSKSIKAKWEPLIYKYLEKRANLCCVFMLIDCRLKPQNIDIEMMNWMGSHEVPFTMVFTKTDKLSAVSLMKNIEAYKKHLRTWWDELPTMFITSSQLKKGKDEILSFIAQQTLGDQIH